MVAAASKPSTHHPREASANRVILLFAMEESGQGAQSGRERAQQLSGWSIVVGELDRTDRTIRMEMATASENLSGSSGYNNMKESAMRVKRLSGTIAVGLVMFTAAACARSTSPPPSTTPAPPPSTTATPAPANPAPASTPAAPATTLRDPDVIYVPTPPEVVEAMLKMANVSANDVVYDLGSGDGRIPIAAAQKYGARGVGIDINPQRIKEANENLAKSNVGDKVRFMNADLFETDLSPATVITLYLLPSLNQKLIPKLKQLKPGTRIVSHSFDMGAEWPPEKTEDVKGRVIYYWTIK